MLHFLLPLLAYSKQLVNEEGNPVSLDRQQFEELEGTHFIKFFSPYCPHCTALEPKWNGAFKLVEKQGLDTFDWASVNCVEQGDLCSEQEIRAYPTLRVYRDGKKIYDYTNHGASEADLYAFAKHFALKRDSALDPSFEKAEIVEEQLEKDKEALEQEAKDLANAEKLKEESVRDSESGEGEREAENLQEKMDVMFEFNDPNEAEKDAERAAKLEAEAELNQETENESVSILTNVHFGPSNSVGRWFVLFTSSQCQGCKSMIQKFNNHDKFAKDIHNINWGRVDCDLESDLCDQEKVFSFPTLRVYQDGMLMYNYKGSTDSMMLRKFLMEASTRVDFDGFSLSDLDESENSIVPNDGQNVEPEYLKGPSVSKPEYGQDVQVMDVVKYTLDTLGKPIDQDPGSVIFGDSPEKHHNFRTWGAPNAPPPPYIDSVGSASHADGNVFELTSSNFNDLVMSGREPWIVKFYSPKCPYCVSMASEYESLAKEQKGKLNVGQVNCEQFSKLCSTQNVDHWPQIVLYKAGTAHTEYKGARTLQGMSSYADQAYAAQIIPIENEDQLSSEIIDNMDRNMTTFVYLYDKTVMDEDWESLSEVAVKINAWGGKLYRSNSDKLRELAGINHRGTAFVNVDFIGESGEGSLKWYDYPFSNIPKRIRDSDEVSRWAYRAKFSLLQYLDPISQTKFSPYVAVILTEGNALPSKDTNVLAHKKKALELRDFYRERQIQDQDRVRVDKLNQHDAALFEQNYVRARKILKEQINMPLFADLSFAYIPISEWISSYGKYIDVTRHKVGSIVVADFYNGVYIDEFNLMPLKDDRDLLTSLVDFLHRYEDRDPKTVFTSLRHFKKSLKGVPKPIHRSTHFHLRGSSGPFSSFFRKLLKVLLVVSVSYILFVKFVRPRLRRAAAGSTLGNTKSVSSKLD